MLRFAKTLIPIIILTALCSAQTFAISGIVTDMAGIPLSDATVSLVKRGITSVTGYDGRFALTSTGSGSRSTRSAPKCLFLTVRNGQLQVSVARKSAIGITIYTLQGKTLLRLQRTFGAGAHYVPLPLKSPGVYLFCAHSGQMKSVVKGIWCGTFKTLQGISRGVSAGFAAVNKNSAMAGDFDDTISATRAGFVNSLTFIGKSDTSGIEIKLAFLADNTAEPATVGDIDGNLYHVVRIGNQLWTAENLRTTHFNDGTEIPLVEDSVEWSALTTPGYCYYNNRTSADSIERLGILYNWHAVNAGKLASPGWHVPDSSEWRTLENYLICNGYNYDSTLTGNKVAKALATQTGWAPSTTSGTTGNNPSANNKSGFSALPGGFRNVSNTCTFQQYDSSAFWWSSTSIDSSQANSRRLSGAEVYSGFASIRNIKKSGLSVRLIRDKHDLFSLTATTNIY